MFRPKSLGEAYSLIKLQETTIAAFKEQLRRAVKTPHIGTSNTYKTPRNYPPNDHPLTTKTQSNTQLNKHPLHTGLLPTPNLPRVPHLANPKNGITLSSKELDERRAKVLYFWCNEWYAFGHKCRKKQVYTL